MMAKGSGGWPPRRRDGKQGSESVPSTPFVLLGETQVQAFATEPAPGWTPTRARSVMPGVDRTSHSDRFLESFIFAASVYYQGLKIVLRNKRGTQAKPLNLRFSRG